MSLQRIYQHKILATFGAIVVVLLLTISGLIIFSEPLLRALVESKGGGKIGRELAIDGELSIDWHWTYTYIHAEKIRLANAPDYPEPNMLTIDALDMSFKPLKLLVGKLELGDITLNKPQLILEKKSADKVNWNFPAFSTANATTEAVVPDNRHSFPLIDKLELKDGKLIYRDAVKGLNLDLQLNSVSGQSSVDHRTGNSDRGFEVSGTGELQEQTFELEAKGGSLKALRDTTQEFPLNIKLVMGATEVTVEGTFKDPIKLTGVNAALKVTGDNMADIFYLTAIPLPPTPPYMLEGQLVKTDSVWDYKDFKGKVGSSDLSGSLSYDISGERGFLKANLVSTVMDSEDLGGFIGLPPSGENAAPEQKQAAAEKKASPKLIPDVPLKIERLRATDMDVTLKAEKISAPNLPFKGLDVHFYLKNGVLKLDPLMVVLADGTVDGSIEIDAQQDVPPMKMNLNVRKLSLARFFENTRFAKTTTGFFGGKVALTGVGSSLADVLASSDGDFTLIISGGKISLLLIEASDIDIGQALPLFLGEDKSTPIRCGVLDFGVKDGILKSKTVVLDTQDSLLVGNMVIDMKREVINAKLDAKPKDTSLLSGQIPIVVTGELKTPSVGLDAKKTEAKGAAAIALGTLLSPFAALLAFVETSDVKNADCRALIAHAQD